MNKYQPVSCDLHSQYELYALQKTRVAIQVRGNAAPLEGIIRDIRIMDNAEFLVLSATGGDEDFIRLDTIRQVTPTGDADG